MTSAHPRSIAAFREQTNREKNQDIQTFTIKCFRCSDYRPKRGSKLIDGKRVCARCVSED